ncbi:MAG TPA: hypothetical protein VIL95_02520 [Bacillota bacterium]
MENGGAAVLTAEIILALMGVGAGLILLWLVVALYRTVTGRI